MKLSVVSCLILAVGGAKKALATVGSTTPKPGEGSHHLDNLERLLRDVHLKHSSGGIHDRLLASDRACGEEIYRIPAAEISAMLDLFVGELVQDEAQADQAALVLSGVVQYDIAAVKVCASCSDVTEELVGSTEGFGNDSEYGFQTYCAVGVYGADATHSAIAFYPIDPETKKLFAGTLRSFILGHSLEIDLSGAPTELLPVAGVGATVQNPDLPLETKLYIFRNFLPPMIASAAGAVSTLPDYLGYGESKDYNRANLMKIPYMQAYTLGFLATRSYLTKASAGCSYLDGVSTLTGFSEGGYSSIVGALTLEALGVRILSVQSGGGPLNLDLNTGYLIDQATTLAEDFSIATKMLVSYVTYLYSSEHPDFLPSVGVDPSVIAEAWDNPNMTPAMNLPSWYEADTALSYAEIVPLLPTNILEIMDPDFIDMYTDAKNTSDTFEGCANGPAPGWELVCQAFDENNVATDMVTIDSFEVSLCYSPQDEAVTYDQLVGTGNSKISEYQPLLPTIAPQGDHVVAGFFCMLDPVVNLVFAGALDVDLNPALMNSDALSTCTVGGSKDKGDGDKMMGDADDDSDSAPIRSVLTAGLPILAGLFAFIS